MKGLAEHCYYARAYPNAALQKDHDEDDFRRKIAEALVSNKILTVESECNNKEEAEEHDEFDDEHDDTIGNSEVLCREDNFVFQSHKVTEGAVSGFRKASPVVRPSMIKQTSDSVLNLNFTFENFSLEEGDNESEDRCTNSEGEQAIGNIGNLQKVQDAELTAIGKQLKQLEKESKASQDRTLKTWQKEVGPVLKESIKHLEKKIEALKKEQKNAAKNKTGFQSEFDEAIRELTDEQDALKLKLFFPSRPPISFGSGGVFISMDYVWLEHLTGKFHLKLSSTSYGSMIMFKLLGNEKDTGIVADITISGFKLKSENKGIPSVNLDNVNIRVSLRIEVLMSFFTNKGKWTCTPDHFVVELLSFKGPFGISRSMVSGLLSIAVPVLKRNLLENLPAELGLLLSEFMIPLEVEGDFCIEGSVTVNELFQNMGSSAGICKSLGYNSVQLLNFLGLQRSLERKSIIKSIMDLIRYRNEHCKEEVWEDIVEQWDKAAVKYHEICSKNPNILKDLDARASEFNLESENNDTVEFGHAAFLSFRKLVVGVTVVEKNPVHIRFSLSTFRLDLMLGRVLHFMEMYNTRMLEELAKKEADGGIVMKTDKMYMEKRLELCRSVQQYVKPDNRVIDHLRFMFRMHLTSGSDGELNVVAKDIFTQFPISFKVDMAPDQDSEFSPLVPTIKNIRTKENGFVSCKLFHLGSAEMLKKAKFLAFKKKTQLDKMLISDNITQREFNFEHSDFTNAASQDLLDASSAQSKIFESYNKSCCKEIEGIKDLLNVRPEKMSFAKIATVNVVRPRMSFIVNDVVTLQPGSAVFTVQVGEKEKTDDRSQVWEKPEQEMEQVMRTRRRKSTLLGEMETLFSEEDLVARHVEKQEEEKGAPIFLEGTNGLRTEATISEIQLQADIPKWMQFIANHFDDVELLSDFYDETAEKAAARADLMQLLLLIVGKYLLVRKFELLLNLGASISSLTDDVSIAFTTEKKYSPALNLFIKVDVVELLKDLDVWKEKVLNDA